MRIAITNDDGIHAEGLLHLVKWAQTLGEVVVFAPKFEQSGKSHSIEIHKPFEVKITEYLPNVTGYVVDSSPADCVRFALLGLQEKFDLVLSGINKGLNVGADIMYSGTVAAIFEAAALGVPGIAMSTVPQSFDAATAYLDHVWQFMLAHDLLGMHGWYNVNFPLLVKGIRITKQGGPYYSDDFLPQENDMYLPRGKAVYTHQPSSCFDTDAVLTDGYISVMPLSNRRWDGEIYDALAHLNR